MCRMTWGRHAIAIAVAAMLVVVTAPVCGRSSPESPSPANPPSTPGQASPSPSTTTADQELRTPVTVAVAKDVVLKALIKGDRLVVEK